MSKFKIKTKERRFETARDLYGIFNLLIVGSFFKMCIRDRLFVEERMRNGFRHLWNIAMRITYLWIS